MDPSAVDADYEMMGSDLHTDDRMDDIVSIAEEDGEMMLAEEPPAAEEAYTDAEFRDEETTLDLPEEVLPTIQEEAATTAVDAEGAAFEASETTTESTTVVEEAKHVSSDTVEATVGDQSEVDELADASSSRIQPALADGAPADETLDDGDDSHDSEEDDGPPTVRVSFNGQDFVVFSEEPTAYLGAAPDATEGDGAAVKVSAPGLKVGQDVFWQPLESLFAALRVKDALGEFLEDGTELVLHMPDLDLTVQEDNVYCRDITLDDLFQLHQGCGLTTSLHILVTETQRFISKYNALAQHVADMIAQADGDAGAELQHHESEEEAEAHEEDELELGDADARESAQEVQEIVSEAQAVEEDAHEAFEAPEAETEQAEEKDADEAAPLATEAEAEAAADAREPAAEQDEPQDQAGDEAVEQAQVAPTSEEAAQAGEEEAEAEGEEQEQEADETYVTVNDGGEDDELEAGEEEGEQEQEYEEEEAEAEADEYAEAEAEADEEEKEGEHYEEEEEEDAGDDSVTLEGSEPGVAAAPEAADEAHAAEAEDQYGEGEEDEIVEYEDHEGLNGGYAIAATSEADSRTYGDPNASSPTKAKRALDDDAQEQGDSLDPVNGEPKRARVELDT